MCDSNAKRHSAGKENQGGYLNLVGACLTICFNILTCVECCFYNNNILVICHVQEKIIE